METIIEKPQFGIFIQKKIDQIEKVVCEYMGGTPETIKGTCRLRAKVDSKHIIFYLLREQTELTFQEIADYYEMGSHTAVYRGICSLKGRMDVRPELKSQVDKISLLVSSLES